MQGVNLHTAPREPYKARALVHAHSLTRTLIEGVVWGEEGCGWPSDICRNIISLVSYQLVLALELIKAAESARPAVKLRQA